MKVFWTVEARTRFWQRLFFGMLVALTVASCAKVTPETPKAATAIKADEIVIRVNEFQAAVIQACGPGPECQSGSLSTALARDLVKLSIDLRTVLKTLPDGWQATVKATWGQAAPRLAAVSNPTIQVAISVLNGLIGGL